MATTWNNGINIGLGGLVVTHSAAGARGAKGPEFNAPVAWAYLSFNSRTSTLAGKQCWLCTVRLHKNCDRIMQCSWHLWFGTLAADLVFDTNGRSEEQLKTHEEA